VNIALSLSPHINDRGQPPNTPQHASNFPGYHTVKAIKPSPGFISPIPDAAVVESGLPNIQGLFISGPRNPHESQAELVHRCPPLLGLSVFPRREETLWLTCSSLIYVVTAVKRSDEAWSGFEINWRQVATRLGAGLQLAAHSAEKPSLLSDESITGEADSLLTIIQSHENCCEKGCFGSRTDNHIARTPVILAGYGICRRHYQTCTCVP